MTQKQCRILVIDDDLEASRKLQVFLKFLGHRPMAAQCAAEGLELARECLPDCVICAVGLRAGNGFSLAHRLREDPRTARTWLVGVSDFGARVFEDLDQASRFDRFLFRPVALPALQEAIALPCGNLFSPLRDSA